MTAYKNKSNTSSFVEKVSIDGEKYEVFFPRVIGVPTKSIVLKKVGSSHINVSIGEAGKVLSHAKIYGNYRH
jgi:hypothetical protein